MQTYLTDDVLSAVSKFDFLYVAVRNVDNRLRFSVLFIKRDDVILRLMRGSQIIQEATLSFMQESGEAGRSYGGQINWNSSDAKGWFTDETLISLTVESRNLAVNIKVYAALKTFRDKRSR